MLKVNANLGWKGLAVKTFKSWKGGLIHGTVNAKGAPMQGEGVRVQVAFYQEMVNKTLLSASTDWTNKIKWWIETEVNWKLKSNARIFGQQRADIPLNCNLTLSCGSSSSSLQSQVNSDQVQPWSDQPFPRREVQVTLSSHRLEDGSEVQARCRHSSSAGPLHPKEGTSRCPHQHI